MGLTIYCGTFLTFSLIWIMLCIRMGDSTKLRIPTLNWLRSLHIQLQLLLKDHVSEPSLVSSRCLTCDSLNGSLCYSINFTRVCSLPSHQFNTEIKYLCSWTYQSLVKNLWKPSIKIIFPDNSSLLQGPHSSKSHPC